jgi:hypothetical protein
MLRFILMSGVFLLFSGQVFAASCNLPTGSYVNSCASVCQQFSNGNFPPVNSYPVTLAQVTQHGQYCTLAVYCAQPYTQICNLSPITYTYSVGTNPCLVNVDGLSLRSCASVQSGQNPNISLRKLSSLLNKGY